MPEPRRFPQRQRGLSVVTRWLWTIVALCGVATRAAAQQPTPPEQPQPSYFEQPTGAQTQPSQLRLQRPPEAQPRPLPPDQASGRKPRQAAQFAAARRQPHPGFGEAQPGDLDTRLRELEQQFEEQRFQFESLQQQLAAERQAKEDAEKKAEEAKKKGYVVGSDTSALGKWLNDGLTFQSKNGDFRNHFGGLANLDTINFVKPVAGVTAPGGAGTQDSVTFRRLRLRAEGTMYETIDYIFELDFAFALQNVDQLSATAQSLGLRSFPTGVGQQGGNTISVIQPTAVFMRFREIPILGNIRVGNQKSWYSMERINSA